MSIVVAPNEVQLYGVRYPLFGPVKRSLVSPFPSKVVIGDYQRADKVVSSEWSLTDLSGGLGYLFHRVPGGEDRFWIGFLETRYQRGITLNTQVYRAQTTEGPFPAPPHLFTVFLDDLYCASDVFLFVTGGGADGQVVFRPVYRGADRFQAGTRIRALVPYGYRLFVLDSLDLYGYSSLDGSWCRYPGLGGVDLVVFDGKLYLLRSDGTFLWTTSSMLPHDPGENGDSIQVNPENPSFSLEDYFEPAGEFPLYTGTFFHFVNYFDRQGEPALYAVTDRGLYIYNPSLRAFDPTPLSWPTTRAVGQPAVWRGELFIPVEEHLYRYSIDLITSVGPSKDDGLPPEYRGPIRAVLPGHAFLYAVTERRFAPQGVDQPESGPHFEFQIGYDWRNDRFFLDQGGQFRTAVYSSPGTNWHGLFDGGDLVGPVGGGIVATIGGRNRVFFAVGDSVCYLDEPSGLHNPLQRPWSHYQESGFLITPWFDSGWNELPKVAHALQLETAGCSPEETILIEMGWDYQDGFEPVALVTENGLQEIPLPYERGRVFRSCRFRITLRRGPDDRRTPVLLGLTLLFYRRPDPVYGWEIQVTTHEPYNGLTPRQLSEHLLRVAAERLPGEFVYRDGDNVVHRSVVLVTRVVAAELTGGDHRGRWIVDLIEVTK